MSEVFKFFLSYFWEKPSTFNEKREDFSGDFLTIVGSSSSSCRSVFIKVLYDICLQMQMLGARFSDTKKLGDLRAFYKVS